MNKPWVYIASPYTLGDQALNTRFQCEVCDKLLSDGLVFPFPPLWNHFQNIIIPRPSQDWIDYDNELITRFDCVLRLNAFYLFEDGSTYFQSESTGADNEVRQFKEMGKPVFYDIESLYAWVEQRQESLV